MVSELKERGELLAVPVAGEIAGKGSGEGRKHLVPKSEGAGGRKVIYQQYTGNLDFSLPAGPRPWMWEWGLKPVF